MSFIERIDHLDPTIEAIEGTPDNDTTDELKQPYGAVLSKLLLNRLLPLLSIHPMVPPFLQTNDAPLMH